MSELSKQALKVDNNQSFPNNNNGAITPSILRAFNVNIIDSTVNQSTYTTDSGSWNAQIDALEAFTSSAVTSAVTASSLITASFDNGTRNLTFTKGNNTTFSVNIPDVSGSTGNFATTGSNTFTGNQTINAELILTGSKYFRIGDNQSISTGIVGGGLTIESQGGNTLRNLAGGGNITLQNTQGAIVISGSATQIQEVDFIPFSASLNARINAATGSGGTIDTGSFATTGSNTFNGNQNISGSIFFPNGAEIRGNASQATLISSLTALQISSSVNSTWFSSNATITSPRTDIRGVETIGDISGTGAGEVYLLGRSGSLILGNSVSTPTYAALSHLSSSQINGNTNLIFKDNSLTGDTIISGSSNIFVNPGAPGAGRTNYIGGSSNFFLNAQNDQLPQITGSAASVSGNRPSMNANFVAGTHIWTINQAVNPGAHTYNGNIIAGGTGQWLFNTMGNTGPVTVQSNLGLTSAMTVNSPSRSVAEINAGASGSNNLNISNNQILNGTLTYNGPVSSSLHNINANSIAGIMTLNLQSGSRAITAAGNIINGALVLNDNTFFAPTLGSINNISNNNINGNATFTNAGSSSFVVSNNNLNTVAITSFLDASAVTNAVNRLSTLNGNAVFGANNAILFSGSVGAFPTGRVVSTNLIAGQFISASLIGDGNNSNLFGTAILGGGLNVFGTTTIPSAGIQQNYGSAFFGRWNATDGNRASTAQTIFAVGTGTSGSTGITRKTGFLIDSGSNSFFEGAVNVSGSLTVQSGSTFFANGNRQFNVGAFQSNVTQSGSANVSQSMNFEVTDISQGVSIVSNSRITLANSGTYNIQFSAQVDRVSGSGTDTVHIWLKKNGTNVSASAGAITVSGAAAAAKTISSWNYVVDAAANDYYELVWEPTDANIQLINQAATGNIPSTPSIILTVTQVR